jgi:BirA family biotin operon repressor/biotin-[acetyl-CoA-carboxylase] ligase
MTITNKDDAAPGGETPRRCDYPGRLKVIALDGCDSTNNYIKSRYDDLKNDLPLLVTSAFQSAGRGRQDRVWLSEPGKGVYSSFAFLLPGGKENLRFLPLLAGIAVIDTLKEITGGEFVLKWPNDVLYRDKKIAGVLIDNVITQDSIFCITGIGINLNHVFGDFPGRLMETAISLRMITGLEYRADEINPCLAMFFFHWLEKLAGGGREEIIKAANRRGEYLLYREISFHESASGIIMEGTYKGIDHDGGLKLGREGGGVTVHYSGEIV